METMNANAYIPIDESRDFALLFGKVQKNIIYTKHFNTTFGSKIRAKSSGEKYHAFLIIIHFFSASLIHFRHVLVYIPMLASRDILCGISTVFVSVQV